MRRNFFAVVISMFALQCSFAQVPESFKYQAVVRDGSSSIITNQAVGIQFVILQGSPGGADIYTETFSTTTNDYGLVDLQIGTGSTFDDFSAIDWSNGPYFIQTSVDITGGSNYSIMGTSQLLSVPYAHYAKSAESVVNDSVIDSDADPTNELQTISVDGDEITLSDGGGVVTVGSFPETYTIYGYAGVGYANMTGYSFVGPTRTITITETRKVCGSAEAPLSVASGTATAKVGLGYKLVGSSVVENFAMGAYSLVEITVDRHTFSACGCSQSLAPGTYEIGMVIWNSGANSVDNNDFVNGWIMVTK